MAGRVSQAFIDEVLNRTDIVELIDHYLPLKKAGHNYSCLCPFHSEKTPSFSVSPTKQFYHCFGCGASGNAVSFLMHYDNLEFLEALELLANQAGLSLPQDNTTQTPQVSHNLFEVVEDTRRFFQQQLNQSASARDYLFQQRGLSQATIDHFQIGFAPNAWAHLIKYHRQKGRSLEGLDKTGLIATSTQGHRYDRFRGRVMFPIRDRKGRAVGFGGRLLVDNDKQPKYLNSPETALFHKSHELYGLYEARQAKTQLSRLIVVEGYMDVVALAEFGITNSVATLGTAITANHLHRLLRTANAITICFDGDEAGQNAAWKAITTALPLLEDRHQVNIVLLPQQLDPDDYIKHYGREAFLETVEKGTTLADYLLNYFQDQYNLETVSGCANFAAAIMPYIHQINASLTHDLLIKHVAKLTGHDVDQLRKTHHPRTRQQQPKTNKTTSNSTIQQTPVRKAIALLVQHPGLVHEVTIDLPLADIPGLNLLRQLIDLLQQTNQNWTTAHIIEHWRDDPAYQYLVRLAQADLLLSDNQLQQELQASLKRLQTLATQHRIDQLIQRSRTQSLTRDEQQELQQLLRQKEN